VVIVTDAAVDLPASLEDAPSVGVVPGQVWLGEEPFVGRTEQFWGMVRAGAFPSTTPPTVEALAQAYRSAPDVLAVHVSAELSATVRRAEDAVAMVGHPVPIVDSRSLSVGAGLVVAATHRLVEEGASLSQAAEYARILSDRLHTFVVVQDVEWLRRSNRSGLLPPGHLARRRPVVVAVRGRVVPLDEVRHRAGALRSLVAHLRRSTGGLLGAWALGHGDAADRDTLLGHLTQELGMPPVFHAPLDPTVGAHLGPESLVVAAVTGAVAL
jgi:DegV family protein with EDD domain